LAALVLRSFLAITAFVRIAPLSATKLAHLVKVALLALFAGMAWRASRSHGSTRHSAEDD